MSMQQARDGFSMIEVIVALTILTVGVLAMGASTGYIMAQIRASELRTERMGVVREASETFRAEPWDSLNSACSRTLTIERYRVNCSISRPNANLALLQLVAEGPGYNAGRFALEVADTFAISIAQPTP